MNNNEIVRKVFSSAVNAVSPSFLVKGYSEKLLDYISVKEFSKIAVVGFGKAAWQMARAVEDSIDSELIAGGIVVTKYGHAGDDKEGARGEGQGALKKISVFEAAHPIPDENGIKATEEIINFLKTTNESTLVLCLVSGGGSALFVSPIEGVTLSEKQAVTDRLLRSGADIAELNSVRKHLSRVKGGRLAEAAQPSEIISLMISDVIGDSLDVIASGPTAPDSSTYRDALDVIEKYGLRQSAPESVISLFERGIKGDVPDTPKAGDPVFAKVNNVIVGSNKIALEAAKAEAQGMGFDVEIVSAEVTGIAREVGTQMARTAKGQRGKGAEGQSKKETKCLISGGETTVVVTGDGKGGRNTELALAFAIEIDGVDGITFLSAGTDGNDGPTDATGAVVDGNTIKKAKAIGLDPQEYLNNNDSYNFFKKIDALLITGPTGTNVMDVQIVLIS